VSPGVPVLRAERISQRFAGSLALSDVTFEVRAGEVHALVGENGAGKSTLVRVLSGAIRPNRGNVSVDGVEMQARTPRDARRHGIAVVHQDYHLFPELSVADNVVAIGGIAPTVGPFVSRRRLRRRARDLLQAYGIEVDPRRPARSLDVSERKLIEITRALAERPRFLVLDEPTAALERRQTDMLTQLMRSLRDQGTGVVFVTHRLDEVLELADRVTVLRNGEHAGVLTRGIDMTADELVLRILGRKPRTVRHRQFGSETAVTVRITGLRLASDSSPVNLEARRGEILGITGLVGSGAATAIRRLAGAVSHPAAEIEVLSTSATIDSPRAARCHGIAFVPADRKEAGIFADLSVAVNLGVASLDRFKVRGLVSRRRLTTSAVHYREALGIKCRSLNQLAATLSGGNQQKVLIGRWLAAGTPVLLMEEPTQGVDIGAREDIHDLVRAYAADGGTVIFLSTDLEETLTLADRIVVFSHGDVVATLPNYGEFRPDKERLVALCSGLSRMTLGGAA